MAVRDDQGRPPPWSDALGHAPTVLALGAVVLYAFLSLCYDRFYGSLAVDASDVGLSYAGTLARSSGFVIVYIFVAGFAVQARVLRRAGPDLAEPSPRVRRFDTFFAVVLIGFALAWPFIGALEAASAVKAGKPVRPLLLPAPVPPLPILAIQADPATVEPAGKLGESPATDRLRGRRLLYLGQTGGTVALYDAAAQRAVYVPAGSIILHVANCGAKPPPDPACEQVQSYWP
jgi:hypothetical protein